MNWTPIQDNWNKLVGRAKDQWSALTKDELIACEGNRERLRNLLQLRCSMTPEEADREIDDFAQTVSGAAAP
jgi:uncharacterized protein YjbJ (UPF0337 family)